MSNLVKTLYGEENVFKADKFNAPPVNYAPVYNWIWNAPVSCEETDKQLDEMQRLGIKAVAIIPEPKTFRPNWMPTLLEPDYLTKPYFEEYKYAVKSAKRRGMLMSLYDEGGWPSGGACGRVMLKHPEYARKSLDARKVGFCKGDKYSSTDDVLVAFDGKELIKDGHIFKEDCEVTEYYILCKAFCGVGSPEFPDLTLKEATDAFIEETHEGYKTYLKEFFGDIVLTVFTDEPTAPRKIPYREEMEEIFENENGYSVRPYLPQFMGDCPITEEGARAKIAWLDLCNRLFCFNYLMRERKWTNDNGMAFMGHMDMDHVADACCTDSGNFNIMRSLRCFDIPGVDAIWNQISPQKEGNPRELPENINGFFPRYASSAAAQTGQRYSFTESFGVYGCGTDFNRMRYVFNYQAVRGINMYNLFGVPYGRKGFLMTGELPYFTEKHACYKDLAVFNRYAERLSYLASLGERVADVALYMPVCDLQAGLDTKGVAKDFEKAGNELEDCRILFDIADDDVFEKVENGQVTMGIARYKTVVVPPCNYMPGKTKKQLEKFVSEGGKVYTIGQKVLIDGAFVVSDAKDILTSHIELLGDTEMVRLCVRKAQNGILYMLFNESDAVKTFDVITEFDYIIDAENGRIIKPDSNKITLVSGQMAFLWQGEVDVFENEKIYNDEVVLDNFTFRPVDRFVIGDMEFENILINKSENCLPLGDWNKIAGEGFSGSGLYKTEFALPKKNGSIRLDLGEVYNTCEVFVNGKSYGVCGMAPYVYELDAEELENINVLEIRVSNTPAAEYLYTKSFDKWQSWQLGPYCETQDVFHRDALQGGIYGPVRILY